MGIHGYWGAYYNIFALCDTLGIKPFTDWTPSHQYSNNGLEVVAPIFRVSTWHTCLLLEYMQVLLSQVSSVFNKF